MIHEKIINSLVTTETKGNYLLGKYHGLDQAEFLLRHIYPCDTEEQKQFLREVADELNKRKLVVDQDRKNLITNNK